MNFSCLFVLLYLPGGFSMLDMLGSQESKSKQKVTSWQTSLISSSLMVQGPSAKQAIGGRPKERGRQALFRLRHPFRQPRQLAEGAEFPEKNAGFWPLRRLFGGGGQIPREKCRS